MQKKKMEPQIAHFALRLPKKLQDEIAAEAKTNNRSINQEIVDRLEYSFKPTIIASDFYNLMEKLKKAYERELRLKDAEIHGKDAEIRSLKREVQ
jgi:hypothetical protein